MKRQQGHDRSAFPLMRLPPELRNHVYRLMVTPVLPYHELAIAGDLDALFNRAILCTNRQVHTEASAAMAEIAITIPVDFRQLQSQREDRNLRNLALLPFKRYSIDFDLTNRTMGPRESLEYIRQILSMQGHIHGIAKALSDVAQLEQLHINCFKPESDSPQNDDTNVEQDHHPGPLPDYMMDCFFQLRGLPNVVITGNLADAYVNRLTRSLKRPKLAPHVDLLNSKLQSSGTYTPVRQLGGTVCVSGCSRYAIEDSDQVISNQHR